FHVTGVQTCALPIAGTCEFQVGRRTRDYTLSPQPATAQNLEAAYRASVYVPSGAPLSVETVNGRPWVNVHSLADDAGWDAFFAQIGRAPRRGSGLV